MTRSGYDVVSTFGCLWAQELPASIIIALLVERGYTASNARNQLARLVLRGLLEVRRVGRQSVYSMSQPLARRMGLASGRQDPPSYHGHLSQLVFEIADAQRWFKDRLVSVAEHHGYGRLRSGV